MSPSTAGYPATSVLVAVGQTFKYHPIAVSGSTELIMTWCRLGMDGANSTSADPPPPSGGPNVPIGDSVPVPQAGSSVMKNTLHGSRCGPLLLVLLTGVATAWDSRPAAAQETPPTDLPTVIVLSTGGTIASVYDPESGGFAPALSGAELVSAVPGIADIAHLEVEDVANIGVPI